MPTSHSILRALGSALDELEVAMCVFDADDRTVHWNQRYPDFFPEQKGYVQAGERYEDSLRRFYASRLSPQELSNVERYVADGVERHRSQVQPFDFDHGGFRLRATAMQLGRAGRARLWRKMSALPAAPSPASPPVVGAIADGAREALECIADGALLVDGQGLAIWANVNFRRMYGLLPEQPIDGSDFLAIFRQAWRDDKPSSAFVKACASLQDQQRFAGAPYEIPLPGDRWTRVIERSGPSSDSVGYCSHVDITALKRQQLELAGAQKRLKVLATTDGLTGVRNRSFFDAALSSEWRRALRGASALSLLMVDIDHFKYLNDKHGHLSGDDVLREVAKVISDHARRAGDVVARFGGEEFVMLLPHTDAATAAALAESLCSSISRQAMRTHKGATLSVTVSIGVSTTDPQVPVETPDILVERADIALYHAKRTGRHRVASHTGSMPTISNWDNLRHSS